MTFLFIDPKCIDGNYVYRVSTYMLMFSRSLRDQCFPLKSLSDDRKVSWKTTINYCELVVKAEIAC